MSGSQMRGQPVGSIGREAWIDGPASAIAGSRPRQAKRPRRLTPPCPAAADIISTVEFDHTGDYLATGDQGGRVVLFERTASRQPVRRTPSAAALLPPAPAHTLLVPPYPRVALPA